jgi:hypothetical protein
MLYQELFAYMSTFFCVFCLFKYTSFYNFAVIEAKKYNDRVTDTCRFIVFGLEKELVDTVLIDTGIKDYKETKNDKETKNQIKEEIKYEDKYLAKFLEFPNEYTFTPEELLAEQFTLINNKDIWANNLKKDIADLQKQLLEVLEIFENGTTLGLVDYVVKMMEKYFKVDATEYLVEDLFNDIIELKTELETQLVTLLENDDIPDFEKDARERTINIKLDTYINNYVLEMTPLGNVYMRYNNNKKSFEYFSNSTIPYRYLEAVGRKYVMTFWCKPLFVNLSDELIKAENKQKTEQKQKDDNKQKQKDEKDTNSVPKKQSFSSKNLISTKPTSSNPVTNSVAKLVNNSVKTESTGPILLKENANRYTWEGRLANLMLLKKPEKKSATLSFAEYKLLQKAKI